MCQNQLRNGAKISINHHKSDEKCYLWAPWAHFPCLGSVSGYPRPHFSSIFQKFHTFLHKLPVYFSHIVVVFASCSFRILVDTFPTNLTTSSYTPSPRVGLRHECIMCITCVAYMHVFRNQCLLHVIGIIIYMPPRSCPCIFKVSLVLPWMRQ